MEGLAPTIQKQFTIISNFGFSKILGENVDETLKQNLEQLTIFAENIISLINTPQAVLEMPREIKYFFINSQ